MSIIFLLNLSAEEKLKLNALGAVNFMPIRPENKARYPANWKEISDRIRFERAEGQCEFTVPNKITRDMIRCKARHGEPHPETGSNVILTVAHLDHTPENCDDDNLRAACQRCHLRYDAHHHRACDKTGRLL